jgi:hypothetical protein
VRTSSTRTSAFKLRERPAGVRKRLEAAVVDGGRPIVISAVTYYEVLRGALGNPLRDNGSRVRCTIVGLGGAARRLPFGAAGASNYTSSTKLDQIGGAGKPTNLSAQIFDWQW